MQPLNTIPAAAEKLGMNRKFLKATIEAGLIKTLKIGERQFVSDAEIARFKSTVSA